MNCVVILFFRKDEFERLGSQFKGFEEKFGVTYSIFFDKTDIYPISSSYRASFDPFQKSHLKLSSHFLFIVRDDVLYNENGTLNKGSKEFKIWLKDLKDFRKNLEGPTKVFVVLHHGIKELKNVKDKDNPYKVEAVESVFKNKSIPARSRNSDFRGTRLFHNSLKKYYISKTRADDSFQLCFQEYIKVVFLFHLELNETLKLLHNDKFINNPDEEYLRETWDKYLHEIQKFRVYSPNEYERLNSIFDSLVHNMKSISPGVSVEMAFQIFSKDLRDFIISKIPPTK